VDAKTTVTNDVWYGLNQPGIADESCLPDGDGIYLCPMLHSRLQGRWPDGWEGTHVGHRVPLGRGLVVGRLYRLW
jgi:hypothetical protein